MILGERRARRADQLLMIAFYPLDPADGRSSAGSDPWVLLVVAGDPDAVERAQGLQPAQAGRDSRPGIRRAAGRCGSSAFAFRHVRLAGGLLTLGLLLNVIVPVKLPWL